MDGRTDRVVLTQTLDRLGRCLSRCWLLFIPFVKLRFYYWLLLVGTRGALLCDAFIDY